MKSAGFIRRLRLRNYKSIASCDLQMLPLMFLVGPNGAGKSNCLDGLRFVADGLRESLDHALRSRGGIHEVRRRSGGHPNHFSIEIFFQLPEGTSGKYGFRIGAQPQGGFEVQEESCAVIRGSDASKTDSFLVKRGQVQESSLATPPAASPDRLYLVNMSGFPEFRPLYEALSRMSFYNLNPDRIRDLQSPDAGDRLDRDGSNLASVLGRMTREEPQAKDRIERYLAQVVPGIAGVSAKVVGPKETLEFRQRMRGGKDPWKFFAANMSDGTLRALGVLISLFQSASGVPVVGLEEPEAALHPAAAGVLRDSLRDASRQTQVLVTSHSPDLLDDRSINPASIVAVLSREGTTQLGPIREVGLSALKDGLYTAGELLRLGQLEPEVPEQEPQPEPDLFAPGVVA
jgi:predicted ATPase